MDMIGIYLKEAIEESGCPVCEVLEKHEHRLMDEILYEHVLDPAVDREFKKSMGLCTYHAWKLKEVAYSNPLYGALGVSIIYERVLSYYISSLKDRKDMGEDECHLCLLAKEKERNTIESLADRLGELFGVYMTSSAVLCKKHFEMLYKSLKEKDIRMAEDLKAVQIQKLELIDRDLERLISKFDYRSKEAPTAREVGAPSMAILALRGSMTGVNICRTARTGKTGILGRIILRVHENGRKWQIL